jgi:hypothetical protein
MAATAVFGLGLPVNALVMAMSTSLAHMVVLPVVHGRFLHFEVDPAHECRIDERIRSQLVMSGRGQARGSPLGTKRSPSTLHPARRTDAFAQRVEGYQVATSMATPVQGRQGEQDGGYA